MRNRRIIESGKPYEIIMRTDMWLPFTVCVAMVFLLKGILGRVLRNDLLILHAFVWMSNHVHFIVTAKDAQDFADFTCELQKKITESIKALLGLKHLKLWESRPVEARILTVETMIERLAYIYSNPVSANLSAKIGDYLGFTTWQDYMSAGNELDCEIVHTVWWARYKSIPRLANGRFTAESEAGFVKKLKSIAIKESYRVQPNSWMRGFGITSRESVSAINEQIKARIELKSAEQALERRRTGKKLVPYKKQAYRPIASDYRPKRKEGERKVYLMCSDKALRIRAIAEYKEICRQCYYCYQESLKGKIVSWPPGTFKPPSRCNASAVLAWY